MSTNSYFPPPGPPPVANTPFDPNASAVGAPVPGPAPEQNQASYQRDSVPQSLLRSQILREMIIRFRKHLSRHRGAMRITFDTLKDVLGTNSRPPLQEHFQNSILLATISKLRNFIDTLTISLTSTDISEVSNLFTDYDKPTVYHSHAPTFKQSLGVIQ